MKLIFFVILTFSAFRSWSACTLTITNFTTPLNFTSNQVPGGQTFRVKRNANTEVCSYFVGFSKGLESTYSRMMQKESIYKIDYNLRATNNTSNPVLKDYPDTTSATEVFTGSFSNGGSTTTTFTYYAVSESWSITNNLRFGLHEDTVNMNVYESAFPPVGAVTPEFTVPMKYQYTVPKNTVMSLLNVGQNYTDPVVTSKTLAFGTITTGESLSFDLVMVYNAGYSISFNSLQGQRLKHSSQNSYVPYTVTMTGVTSFPALAAGSTVVVTSGSGVSPSAPLGDRRTTTITLGNAASGFPGAYAETITITMTATE